MMKIQCLTHVPFEDAARIGDWAVDRGHGLTYTRLYRDDPLPDLDAFDMLAVMGGPMNIYESDAYPWLIAEKALLRHAVDAGKTVLGVCLGAQLIADVLGGRVTPNPQKEIGWHPVTLTEAGLQCPLFSGLPRQIDVFHWHGDTFSIPPKAVRLAASQACPNQAFLYRDRVLALQFHLEYSPDSIEKMLTHCSTELVKAPYINNPQTIRAGLGRIPQATQWLYAILDNLTNGSVPAK